MRSRIKNVCFLSGTGVRKCVFSSWLVEVFKQLTGQYWGGGGQVRHGFREPPQFSAPSVLAALGRRGTQECVVRHVLLGAPAWVLQHLSKPLLWGAGTDASGPCPGPAPSASWMLPRGTKLLLVLFRGHY